MINWSTNRSRDRLMYINTHAYIYIYVCICVRQNGLRSLIWGLESKMRRLEKRMKKEMKVREMIMRKNEEMNN